MRSAAWAGRGGSGVVLEVGTNRLNACGADVASRAFQRMGKARRGCDVARRQCLLDGLQTPGSIGRNNPTTSRVMLCASSSNS